MICKILKIAKPAIVDSLTYLMNMPLNTGVFPHAWKETKIIPPHKGGDLSDTNNYRPIAILLVIIKSPKRLFISMCTCIHI